MVTTIVLSDNKILGHASKMLSLTLVICQPKGVVVNSFQLSSALSIRSFLQALCPPRSNFVAILTLTGLSSTCKDLKVLKNNWHM